MVGQEVIQARFTITSDMFEGVVFTPGDWHYIEPLRNYLPNAEATELVVYKQSDIKPGQAWRCGVSHRLQEGRDRLEARAAATDTTTTYAVEVATEADYEYVQYWGSASAANREIQAILNQVEGVYETELKLKLEIVYQHAWTRSSDPYSGTDGGILLEQFREHWNANFYAEGYDLAHLWTGRETLTSRDEEDEEERDIAGLAWLGTVCRQFRNGSGSYGISKSYTKTPFKFSITAHEIGHNFDATHPDEEEPPVASCARTIMQGKTTVGDLLTFCPFSENQIRDHVSTYNSCLEATTGAITLNPPSNLRATALGPHRVRLSWNDTNGEDAHGFRVERRRSGRSWGLLVWLWRSNREYIDGSVQPETTYSYRIYAYPTSSANAEISPWSRTSTVTTPPVSAGEGASPLTSKHWIIPTSANTPGRFGGIFKTAAILWNFDREDDLEVTAKLYGTGGLVEQETIILRANTYRTYGNFLASVFRHRGAGAIELTADEPFNVPKFEVYIDTDNGRNTTVVSAFPFPLRPYSGTAISFGIAVSGGYRTNIGVFNSSSHRQTVAANIWSGQGEDDPLQVIEFDLPAKAWSQKSVTARVERGYIYWQIPREAYLYVVGVDNESQDGTLTYPVALE